MSDPFALARQRLEFDEREDLIVTPEIEDLTGTPDAAFGANVGASRTRNLFRTGEEYYTMRQYHEGDDLRRIHWPSVARTGELMIRQDESSQRANGLVFLDSRDGALGQTHGQAFERAVSVAATLGVLLSRGGFSLRFATADTPPAALSEERFLEALTGVGHSQARSIGPALAHLRASASGDTTLVVVAAPPQPVELTSLIRSGGGVRPQARRPRLPRRPRHPAARAAGPAGGTGHAGPARPDPRRMGLHHPAPVHALEGQMARPQGTSPRAQRLIALFAVCAIAIATAFAFGRVFIGHGSTWRLMAVALASALVACALERRNLLLATLVSARGARRGRRAPGLPRARPGTAFRRSTRCGTRSTPPIWSASRPASRSRPRRR